MPLNEQGPESSEAPLRYIEIPLTCELNENWCGIFTEAYGAAGKRAMFHATNFIARTLQLDCLTPSKKIDYETIYLTDPDEIGSLVDGRIVGTRVIPLYDKKIDDYYLIAHAIMSDTLDLESGVCLTADSEELIFVPLTNAGEGLMLYDP